MTGELIAEMLNIREKFSAEYERRFFIVGLSKMLMSPQLPNSLQPQLLRLLNELVESITQLHDQVTKRVKAAAEREAKLGGTDSDDEDEDDLSDEEEDKEAESKTKKSAAGKTEDESKAATMDDDALGFTEKAAAGEDAAEDGDEGDDDDE